MTVKIKYVIMAIMPAALAGLRPGVAANVVVDTVVNNNFLKVGQTENVNVTAQVQNPVPQDGIFTFDLNVLLGDSSVVQIVPGSVKRNGVDPLLGGSDGVSGSGGNINNVSGGYGSSGLGISSAQTLFSFQIKANKIGTGSVGVGPSLDPYGNDFFLWQTAPADTTSDYTSAVVNPVTVGATVPEPASAVLVLFATAALAIKMARRHCG